MMPMFPLWFLLTLVVISFICGRLFERDAFGIGSENLIRAAKICYTLIEALDEVLIGSKNGLMIYYEALVKAKSTNIRIDIPDKNSVTITKLEE